MHAFSPFPFSAALFRRLNVRGAAIRLMIFAPENSIFGAISCQLMGS